MGETDGVQEVDREVEKEARGRLRQHRLAPSSVERNKKTVFTLTHTGSVDERFLLVGRRVKLSPQVGGHTWLHARAVVCAKLSAQCES